VNPSRHVHFPHFRRPHIPLSGCARTLRRSGADTPACGPILGLVDAEPAEWPVESWARRTRSTAVVALFVVSIALLVAIPAVGARLGGGLMIVAGLWYWLPVVLRSAREGSLRDTAATRRPHHSQGSAGRRRHAEHTVVKQEVHPRLTLRRP
jgi:hypothetical protein